MNKTHLSIARKKRELGWTYKNIAAYLQKKGARTRDGKDLYGAYVINELNSSEMERSRIDDRVKQKRRIIARIKQWKEQVPPMCWAEITRAINADGFKNMRGGEFSTGSLKRIWGEVQAEKKAEK